MIHNGFKLIIIWLTTTYLLMLEGKAVRDPLNSQMLSHQSGQITELTPEEIQTHENRIRDIENPSLPYEEEISLLHDVTKFDLGRFLLENKGLNGYWTAYLILHGPRSKLDNPLEQWLIDKAPAVRATRERFEIFQREIQNRLRSNMRLASIPCGTMDDLLTLDYTDHTGIELIGIDLDPESLKRAEANAERILVPVRFEKKDAMALETSEQVDLITSNGLNIYEPDDKKVVVLYKNFHKALVPGGFLVTSFLTPPPALSPESTWKDYNEEDALKQKALFTEVLGVKWQSFRTEAKTREQLREAGFVDIEFIYDRQGMFPTVIAKKPSEAN